MVQLPDGGTLPVPPDFTDRVSNGQRVLFGFRADSLMPVGHALAEVGETANVDLKVTLAEPLGSETMLLTELAGVEIQGKMHNPRPVAEGEEMTCVLALEQCHMFDAETGNSLR
jgi:multiple sugar transport system ATP-binding protein